MLNEITIVDGGGKKRKCIIVGCTYCAKPFPKPRRFIGEKNYCSTECSAADRVSKMPATCALCKKAFMTRHRRTKSGLIFCSKRCKDLGQSSQHNLLECGLPKTGADYRNRALQHYGETCEWCTDTCRLVLDVHHLDHNRANNELENLMVLCACCHALETRGYVIIENRTWKPAKPEYADALRVRFEKLRAVMPLGANDPGRIVVASSTLVPST